MKKRLLTTIIAFALFIAMSSTALVANAAEENDGTVQRVLITKTGDASALPGVSPQAVSAPTSYAPSSWYNVQHNWTATKYTYSSYIFNTAKYPLLDIAANASFTVEFYTPDGTFLSSATPSYNSEKGKYYGAYFFLPGDDYYMIIRNNSGSPISSGAWYVVGSKGD